MIQKFTVYRWSMASSASVMSSSLEAAAFSPTGPTQVLSVGFVPPREVNGAFLESVGGEGIARVMIERRSVPSAAVRKLSDEMADHIEATTGRKPGKKERRMIKDDALLQLLPQAFPKQAAVPVWFSNGFLVVGSTSTAVLDEVVMLLVRAIDGLTLTMFQTNQAPATAMTAWLLEGEAPGGFSLGQECELKACDETKAIVRYSRHSLGGEGIRRHVTEGKLPRRLALDWKGRVSFRLSDSMSVDKVELLDVMEREDNEDAFDADVAITTGELKGLIADLIDALGGELRLAAEGGAA